MILPDRPAVCAVDVRGGGPGTRETDALSPETLVPTVDAETFAADWLGRYLAEFPANAAGATTVLTRPGGPARAL